MSDRTRGLFRKFIVTRTDGTSEAGQKHDGCEYFVLDMTHDPYAKAAASAYVDACKADYPLLAADMVRDFKLRADALAPPEPPIKEARSERGIGPLTSYYCDDYWTDNATGGATLFKGAPVRFYLASDVEAAALDAAPPTSRFADVYDDGRSSGA